MMKTKLRNSLITLVSVALMSAMALFAQTQKSEIAEIPFAFQVGDKVMPAGTYYANLLGPEGIVQLENKATLRSIIVNASVPLGGPRNQSQLTFRCYSGRCFLSAIRYAGEGNGHGLIVSRREKEIAANNLAPTQIYLAAR